MKKYLILIALATNITSFSQNVEWSPLVKSGGKNTTILPVSGKSFYTTMSNGTFSSSYSLKRFDDFTQSAIGKINQTVETGKGYLSYELINNGKYVAFISDVTKEKTSLFYQEYNASCMPDGEPVLISSFETPNGWRSRGSFDVIQSENKEFFAVQYEIPGKKEESDRFGYKVMSSTFETISQGEYESPYNSIESEFQNSYVSNKGDFFLGMRVFNIERKGNKVKRMDFKKYNIYIVKDGDLEEIELKLTNKFVSQVYFKVNEENELVCTGIYGEDKVAQKGAFYFKVDIAKNTINSEGFSEFTKEFITQDFTEKEKERADKREAKGKAAPQLYNYNFREVHLTTDGGVVVVLEQYYVIVTTTTDSKGNVRTTYTYYYNDLITYRVQNDGEFDWIKKIDKSQVSQNDGGRYSSIGGYFSGDNYVMFFNDNNKNYSESGDFLDAKIYSASMRKKKNCVAKVEIDLTTGEYDRKRFTSREETSAIAVPKKFQTDYVNNEMFMYLIDGKKEKFGLLKF